MATYTNYKSLEKPLSAEKYNVAVANKNNDVIDSELHKLDLKNQSQDELLATKESLNSEITRATSKENDIIDDLASEISRAKSVENSNSDDIANEVARALIAEENISTALQDHISDESNPHGVTKGQIELGNVDNTSDMDKPVSTAQQNALDLAVSTHNTSDLSHNDMRLLISELAARLNALADSDDATLDQLSEIVAYIKNNKSLIDGITTNKVNVSDIIDNLTTNSSDKVLSAKQGKVVKDLIDELTITVGNKVDKVSGKGLSTNDYTTSEKNKLNGIASGAEVNVQSDWSITDTTSDAYIKNKPTSMPASDVSSWAKASTKPAYTKSEVGLGNVENKNSATIRSELTKENVTDALGYIPPTTNTTYTASSTAPKAPGTASAGSESSYARGDHVHPSQTSVSGNAGTATKWATARNIDGMSVQGDANRITYGTCSTAAATAAKVVSCTGFSLVTGAKIDVKFTVTNTAANPTLNVNNTGAKAIYYRGSAISAGYLAANRTYSFRYNGTQYELVGDINTDTNTTYGVVSTTANGLCPKRDGSTEKYLRGDGTWAKPTSGGITYSESQPATLSVGMTWIGP